VTAALIHLVGQIAIHVAQSVAHVVERFRQLLHFIAAVHRHAMFEVATGEPFGAQVKIANGVDDPAEEITRQANHQSDADATGADDDDDTIAKRFVGIRDELVDVVFQLFALCFRNHFQLMNVFEDGQ